MRDYGKVNSSFWTSESIRSLSDDGRMLSLYLLTSPHANMTGCFRLPDGYLSREERRCLMNRAIVLTVIKLVRCGLITPATIKG
ncbi:hypothetical protein FTY95_05685 [Salmonella enterica]|nr:hypothetical protein [Salmonella enterica]